jgi:insertion element IS1 protein InsB
MIRQKIKKIMLHQAAIICPHCQSNDLVKNGKSENGTQKWRSSQCRKHFRREYRYNACKAGTKEKIIEMTLNSSGVRDTGRVLKISKDTVCSVLKKTLKMNPYFLNNAERASPEKLEVEIRFSAEMDEFWSYVQNKGNQRWTWYGIERQSGVIPAWHNGKRRDRDSLELWKMPVQFPNKTLSYG